jgi:transaldolase
MSEFFLDSANLDDIKACVERGIISGVTVNQSLLAKEPKRPYEEHLADIVNLLRPDKLHLSAPVPEGTPEQMIEAGKQLRAALRYENLALKVPVSWAMLPVIHELSKTGAVNATCVFTALQAKLGADAGANAVSVFVGRINDADEPQKQAGYTVLRDVHLRRYNDQPIETHAKATLFNPAPAPEKKVILPRIIAGSIRDSDMAKAAILAGADIVTTSRAVLEAMATDAHSQTSIDKFNADWTAWTSP